MIEFKRGIKLLYLKHQGEHVIRADNEWKYKVWILKDIKQDMPKILEEMQELFNEDIKPVGHKDKAALNGKGQPCG